MLEVVKVKTQNLVSRLSKLTTVANPALGPDFLEEVHIHHLTLWTLKCNLFHLVELTYSN
jgi:hypothetical protein